MKRRLEEEARGGKRGGTNTDNDSNVRLGGSDKSVLLLFQTFPFLYSFSIMQADIGAKNVVVVLVAHRGKQFA